MQVCIRRSGVAEAALTLAARPECYSAIAAKGDPAKGLAKPEDHRVGTKRELPWVDHLLSRFVTKRTFQHQIKETQHRFVCRELRDLLYLLPDGSVVRCGMDHEPIGNVRSQNFDEIWFGDSMEKYRKKVDDCPGCLQASVQILSRVYGGCLDG